MIQEAVPAVITDVPWLGDGPSIGIGNGASDAWYGENTSVPGPPSIVHARGVGYPWPSHHQELAGPVYYPGALQGGAFTLGQAQQAPQVSLAYQYQDLQTPLPFAIGTNSDIGDIALGAPAIPSGAQFIGRP
jgi:hypothetical protein